MLDSIHGAGAGPGLKTWRVLAGVIDDAGAHRVVENGAGVGQQDGQHHRGRRKNHKGEQRHRVVGGSVLLHGAVCPACDSAESSEERTDEKQAQADADTTAHFIVDRSAVDCGAEIFMAHAVDPAGEPVDYGSLVVQVESVELRVDDFGRGRRIAALKVRAGVQSQGREKVSRRGGDEHEQGEIDSSLKQEPCQAVIIDGPVFRGRRWGGMREVAGGSDPWSASTVDGALCIAASKSEYSIVK